MTNAITTVQSLAANDHVKLLTNGAAVFSLRGVAKIVGINDSVLVRSFQGADFSTNKLAQFLIQQGVEGADIMQCLYVNRHRTFGAVGRNAR